MPDLLLAPPMKAALAPKTIVALTGGCLTSELADEVVVLSLAQGRYYGLDPVGAFIWQALEEPQTFEALVAAVLETFDVEPAQAEADVTAFIRSLEAERLVEVREAP